MNSRYARPIHHRYQQHYPLQRLQKPMLYRRRPPIESTPNPNRAIQKTALSVARLHRTQNTTPPTQHNHTTPHNTTTHRSIASVSTNTTSWATRENPPPTIKSFPRAVLPFLSELYEWIHHHNHPHSQNHSIAHIIGSGNSIRTHDLHAPAPISVHTQLGETQLVTSNSHQTPLPCSHCSAASATANVIELKIFDRWLLLLLNA